MSEKQISEFEKAASEEKSMGFLAETWAFLKENKKWWLLPIVAVLLVFGALVLLSGSAAAPFIYTLF
jgi:drug/metabolite transporter superfamily protein YnfA